jgi:hypothetical protein
MAFEDWRQVGRADSVYATSLGIELSMGDLHSGATFVADVTLPAHIELEILKAMSDSKAYPVFRVIPNVEKELP